MGARSYQVAVVTEVAGERVPRSGYLQIAGENGLSGANVDDAVIREAVLRTFPDAVEYLPMRIPNRQLRAAQQQACLQRFGMAAIEAMAALAEPAADDPYTADMLDEACIRSTHG